MIGAKEAKRLESIQKNLISKFRAAEKEEASKRDKMFTETKVLPSVSLALPPSGVLPPPPLDVSKAKHIEHLKRKLQSEFAESHERELDEQREREKKYEAITKAIKEKREADIVNEQKTKEWLRKQKYNQLMNRRFRPSVTSTPEQRKLIGYIGTQGDNDDDDDEDNKMEVEEVAAVQNTSMKQLMDTKVVNLGAIGTRYLPRANDNQFGIYYDEEMEKLKIGSENIAFDFDDIILQTSGSGRKRFKGTEGLWKLLTLKGFVKPESYTSDDWWAYKNILLSTNSLYQKNDPSTKRPKASQGQKWKKLIKPVWDAHVKNVTVADDVFGSGLKEYNEHPIEYRYINNLKELIDRLNFIHAEEMAGNHSFHNEKLSVVRFINDRMEELIGKPNGMKYIVRCLSALPEQVIQGSGLLNDIINKLPFELHAPQNWNFDTYNYCGPGTKLDKRLARGDKGVNPLDEACKQHDIWYRDHKKTEDRWAADKVLQKAAWDRVTSADADVNERAVGLATTGAMWLKRKLGMGLGTSGCVYPAREVTTTRFGGY